MKTLDAMGLASVIKARKLQAYIKMMKSDRSDFAISEYATLTTLLWAKRVVRIDCVKVGLMSTRMFSISLNRA